MQALIPRDVTQHALVLAGKLGQQEHRCFSSLPGTAEVQAVLSQLHSLCISASPEWPALEAAAQAAQASLLGGTFGHTGGSGVSAGDSAMHQTDAQRNGSGK